MGVDIHEPASLAGWPVYSLGQARTDGGSNRVNGTSGSLRLKKSNQGARFLYPNSFEIAECDTSKSSAHMVYCFHSLSCLEVLRSLTLTCQLSTALCRKPRSRPCANTTFPDLQSPLRSMASNGSTTTAWLRNKHSRRSPAIPFLN